MSAEDQARYRRIVRMATCEVPAPKPKPPRTYHSMADLLPANTCWSDPLTPDILRQILDAYDAKLKGKK